MPKPLNIRNHVSFWEREFPRRATTGKLRLFYYRQSGLLVICSRRSGQTVTLEQTDMQNNPSSLKLLSSMLNDWERC